MQFVDVSGYNTAIDWTSYRTWSNMVALKSTEGVGFTDPTFSAHRAGALAAGMESIWYYHFARPDTGNDPAAEANYQHQVVGAIRTTDFIVLDFEVEDARATAEWAYQFLAQQERNYGGKPPILYASDAYIRARLQDSRLAHFPLWLAHWTYDPNARPACPPPWSSYTGLQYSDRATIPGIAGLVDADIFLGETMIPTGWKDNPQTGVLTAPNGIQVVRGFRDYILGNLWDADDVPQQAEAGLSPLEQSNPTLGGGTWQPFLRSVLEWTQDRGVFKMYTGRELWYARRLLDQALASNDALAARVKTLQGQIAALQSQIATPPANIVQAMAALNAINTMAAQLKADGDTIAAATTQALAALGSH